MEIYFQKKKNDLQKALKCLLVKVFLKMKMGFGRL